MKLFNDYCSDAKLSSSLRWGRRQRAGLAALLSEAERNDGGSNDEERSERDEPRRVLRCAGTPARPNGPWTWAGSRRRRLRGSASRLFWVATPAVQTGQAKRSPIEQRIFQSYD